MVAKCVLCGVRSNEKTGRSFHKFPKADKAHSAWMKACCLTNCRLPSKRSPSIELPPNEQSRIMEVEKMEENVMEPKIEIKEDLVSDGTESQEQDETSTFNENLENLSWSDFRSAETAQRSFELLKNVTLTHIAEITRLNIHSARMEEKVQYLTEQVDTLRKLAFS